MFQVRHNFKRLATALGVGVLLAVAAALPGCVSQRAGLEIPSRAQVVGGGRVIEYQADVDGILFLVDQRDLIASQTIGAGELYKVNGSVEVGDGTTIELLEARLYFLPDGAWTTAPDDDEAERELRDEREAQRIRELEALLGTTELAEPKPEAGAALEAPSK